MSARSSSGSWSGAGGAPPDIIDLDKFMRGAVRPPRKDLHAMRCGDKLVVDAGGVDRKPGLLTVAAPPAPPPALSAPSDSGSSRAPPHAKRFSHDSGLSETSYARRKHRPHRRAGGADSMPSRAPRTPLAGSSGSLRAFRAVCERALLDQQAQIARVAQLCERLSERPPPRRRSERSVSDTSDVSSSSRSTRDQRRKDKHRTEECKTYKIIMNKLDELNRLFAARARSPTPALPAPPAPLAPPRRLPASSGSVSVSDKLVATEPVCLDRPDRRDAREHHVLSMRGGSQYAGGSTGAGGSSRVSGRRAPPARMRAHDPMPRYITESVVMCESGAGTGTSGGDPRCGFDLDDPVHLYSQAKRLQAMPATTRRARSVDSAARRRAHGEQAARSAHSPRAHVSHVSHVPHSRAHERREASLCAWCRGYWRALTHYLAAQIFCCPDAAAVH